VVRSSVGIDKQDTDFRLTLRSDGGHRTKGTGWVMAAPDREKALGIALAQIEKNYGKGSIMRLGDEGRAPVEVIPTGSIALDVALGIGGLPRGRVVEIYGPESSGKTTVTLHAVASVQAARSLPFSFTLAARAENFVRGNPDLDDTIRRLVSYEHAGADVLFAPGLPDLAAVRAVCSALSKPVNFVVGARSRSFTVAELVAAGVKRISFGGSFYRAAMSGLAEAAQEARTKGTFTFVDHIMITPELNRFFPE